MSLSSSQIPFSQAILLTLAFGLIYLAFLPPGIYSLDGNGMLAVAESLVAHHSWAVPAELGFPGRDGQFFSKWYPLLSILAVPFVAIATQAAHILRLPTHYLAAILATPLALSPWPTRAHFTQSRCSRCLPPELFTLRWANRRGRWPMPESAQRLLCWPNRPELLPGRSSRFICWLKVVPGDSAPSRRLAASQDWRSIASTTTKGLVTH